MRKMDKGLLNGLLGVAVFSGSLPATRMALEGFAPLLLTSVRALVAGLAALLLLAVWRRTGDVILPEGREWGRLCVVASGVVLGFPLLTAVALQSITATRSLVFGALLPLSTAIFGVLRGGERPAFAFWIFAGLGAGAVVTYALFKGAVASSIGDGLMVAAVLACGLGYAEGGALSRRLGGAQVICWALVLSLPFSVTLSFYAHPVTWSGIGLSSWLALGYVSLFSMLIGFVFWYRGLALGGIARVGQLQLLQPFMGLGLAAWLLGERVDAMTVGVAFVVVGCVAGARRFA
ncbi:DMT family transporter [Novosphingobium umbonatum]|uniref:DMT family transporter n=1 Tax=Novosphingobium umbonatum TaxID=1908524 RepID=A0A3S2USI8_9SPHN|nr:DMT family transporter [Novosphingobium umbonatum]RVU03685.1 DMT family transporter [Novosphingobium umbonatum]